ncbi:peptide-methionine (S)-S-oxide reductase [Photobacterium sp. DNB23_23_1]
MMKTLQLGFSGSCYWCMEAVFQSLDGVISAEQGWMSAGNGYDRYEAVLVEYDPLTLSISVLVGVHLHTHHATSSHPLRCRYPSAIYTYTESQRLVAIEAIALHQEDFSEQLVTGVEEAGSFTPCEDEKQGYYFNHPERPFCEGQIAPKLHVLLSRFGMYVNAEKRQIIEQASKGLYYPDS